MHVLWRRERERETETECWHIRFARLRHRNISIIQIFIIECVALFICLYSPNNNDRKKVIVARPTVHYSHSFSFSHSLARSHFTLSFVWGWAWSAFENIRVPSCGCAWLNFCCWLKVWVAYNFFFYFRRSRSYLLSEHVTVFEYINAIMQGITREKKKQQRQQQQQQQQLRQYEQQRPVYTNTSHLFSIYCVNTLCQI